MPTVNQLVNILLLPLVLSLIVSCTPSAEPTHFTEPSITPSSPTPRGSGNPTSTPQARETTPMETASSPTPEKIQPPADVGPRPHLPIKGAQGDLAQRLDIDPSIIQVVEVITRDFDIDVVSCLAFDAEERELQTNLDQVQWLTLSAKNEIYHYVLLENLVIFCEK